MKRLSFGRFFIFSAILICAVSTASVAKGETPLETREVDSLFPLETRDAHPLAEDTLAWTLASRLTHLSSTRNPVYLLQRIQYGLSENAMLAIESPYSIDGEQRGSGNMSLDLFYRLVGGEPEATAIAIEAGAELPSGVGTKGLDPDFGILVSQRFGEKRDKGLHGNFTWVRNESPQPGERNDYRLAVVGFHYDLSPGARVVADVSWDFLRETPEPDNQAGIGFQYRTGESNFWAAGFSLGFDEASPDYKATLSFRQGFRPL